MNQLMIKKKNELATNKKKGFTLIELIIVIAIIAILAAVAIPKFGAVKENANLASDQANAKIIATAVAQAVSDGLVIEGEKEIDSSNYVKYIDGGEVPTPKYKGATDFYVTYDTDTTTAGKGTIIKLYKGATVLDDEHAQVYPVK